MYSQQLAQQILATLAERYNESLIADKTGDWSKWRKIASKANSLTKKLMALAFCDDFVKKCFTGDFTINECIEKVAALKA